MTSADLLLHPVRLRILQTFLGDRALTTSQLRTELPDIPPATLYRHVAKLATAGVLTVVSERQTRGAVERTYALQTGESTIAPRELATYTTDDHRRMFVAFIAGLLREYDRYLASDEIDLLRDGVSFGLTALWLSEAEASKLTDDLKTVLGQAAANTPRRDRTRRLFAPIAFPAPDPQRQSIAV